MTKRSGKLMIEAVEGPFCGPDIWSWLHRAPDDQPLLWLGSDRSAYSLLALAWDEVEPQAFWQSRPAPARIRNGLPWTTGTLCLLSYDAYNPWRQSPGAPVRCFRIRRSLVIDHRARRAFQCSELGADRCRWQLSDPLSWPKVPRSQTQSVITWEPTADESYYLEQVERVRRDILAGRYYQLNLLRYWRCAAHPSRAQLIERLRLWGGPYAALIELPDLALLSMSPERFFSLARERSGPLRMEVAPIKGTRPVRADPAADAREREDLARHPKDRAELSMIIDLMRNDLHRIALPGAVRVEDPGRVHSFTNVHHLIGIVSAQLPSHLSWGDILTALCPGGSITGAPKREVMLAIREYEGRERGYLMGHLLYADAHTGRADASILIRTAIRLADQSWEFAAGSGLVVQSQADEEAAEVTAKARVVLADDWHSPL